MKYLIVVDMQNDFISGPLGSPAAQAIVEPVRRKIEEYTDKDGWEVVFTKDTHRDDYLDTQEGRKLPVPHCIIDTEGWEIPQSLLSEAAVRPYTVLEKSAFGFPGWEEALSAPDMWHAVTVDEILLVGLCTDICVISNAMLLKAAFPEARIRVDASCCAGVTPESHRTALNAMKACQIEIENEGDEK